MPITTAKTPITLFMAGDVMTGRGIDQVLPYANDPQLHETYVKDARGYVALAEQANGPIPDPVDFTYIWGEALAELERLQPDLRIINLETSVTTSSDHWPGKGIHYRMNPRNIPTLTAARIDYCALANNHVLDWGYSGLAETLTTFQEADIHSSGAGQDLQAAAAPARLIVPNKGRVLLFSYGLPSSGIPARWLASAGQPGLNVLPNLSAPSLQRVKEEVTAAKKPGDLVVASIHWGGNWGYQIPPEQIDFAHQLIDQAGVDIIHGHSSHHFKGIEVYREKLIIYGAGDFLNDYEGIGGHEEFRPDLVLMYFVSVNPKTGQLIRLRMTPLQIKQFQLHRACDEGTRWARDVLTREGQQLGTGVEMNPDGTLSLRWRSP